MAVGQPTDGRNQIAALVIAQCVNAQSGCLRNLLNGEFLCHIPSLEIRARSKSSTSLRAAYFISRLKVCKQSRCERAGAIHDEQGRRDRPEIRDALCLARSQTLAAMGASLVQIAIWHHCP